MDGDSTDEDDSPERDVQPESGSREERPRAKWRRVRRALSWILTSEDEPRPDSPEQRRLRRLRGWIAVAIVAVSILSAFAAWRASVHDEAAAHHEAGYRQALVLFQQSGQSAEDLVFGEATDFAAYRERRLRARRLGSDAGVARQAGDAELATRFEAEALRETRIADAQRAEFQLVAPETADGHLDYDPVLAYEVALRRYQVASLDPGELRHEATAAGRRGVRMTLVAALFIAALVFLTLAEVAIARRLAPDASPADPSRAAFAGAATRVLIASAVAVTLAAIALFATTPWG